MNTQKRIAVLISGEYRTFDLCRKTMNFLNADDVDVYVSTWDTSAIKNKRLHLNIVEAVTEERIKNALGNVQAKAILVEPLASFNDEGKKYNSKMIHRWVTGLELIKQSGIEYDYVLVVRPDLYFRADLTPTNLSAVLPSTLDKDCLYTGWSPNANEDKRLGDVHFLTTMQNMFRLLDENTSTAWNTDSEGDWHIWWYSYAKSKMPTVIQTIDVMQHFCFCRFYETLDDSFATTFSNFEVWRNTYILDQIAEHGYDAVVWWSKDVKDAALRKLERGDFAKYYT